MEGKISLDQTIHRGVKAQSNHVEFPCEPIKAASILIDAQIGNNKLFTITDLREIAGHLILYCDSEEGVE